MIVAEVMFASAYGRIPVYHVCHPYNPFHCCAGTLSLLSEMKLVIDRRRRSEGVPGLIGSTKVSGIANNGSR